MLPEGNHIKYLVGGSLKALASKPLIPYHDLVCEFLNHLSSELLSNPKAKPYADITSFAFWCRRANISKLREQFPREHVRLGVGLVFHIAPSNVPINFAFSFAFSLLAGNANIVRVPSKDFPQTGIVCDAINKLLGEQRYQTIAEMTAFVQYQQDDQITGAFSSQCNARIIWGGDETIKNIRNHPIPERSIDIAFADRYSFCVMDGNAILKSSKSEIEKLANAFYNDTYLMDQNACSSPHLIIWLTDGSDLAAAKRIFWDEIYGVASSKYELQPVNAVDKYMALCENAIELDNIAEFHRHGNYLYRLELSSLPDHMDRLRGRFGYFYEYATQDLNTAAHIVNTKYQTLTYFGLEKAQLIDFVIENRLNGIDRIVPVGSALDINVIWDGYDMISTLSRIIDFK